MSAPLVVNTRDGVCWTRRTVTSGGIALYAPEQIRTCPGFVMATIDELAEHGIVGSADALPVPIGPETQAGPRAFRLVGEVTADDYDEAVWAAEQAVSGMRGQGYKGSVWVEPGDGQAELRARVAELESERHSTNELLSKADEALSANRDRIAELEARLAERVQAADTYPPALPWAKLMDHEDLTDFLDELAASAITHVTSEVALDEVESTIARWRAIGEAQHAHNTAPGPDEPDEDRPGMRHAVRTEDNDPARCLKVHPFSPRDGWRMVCGNCDHGKDSSCHRVEMGGAS